MKRADRPRRRQDAHTGRAALSETRRPGAALRLSESHEPTEYVYDLGALKRRRSPAEARAAARDEMPELPEYIVKRIRTAKDEGEGACEIPARRGRCARSRLPEDTRAPLPNDRADAAHSAPSTGADALPDLPDSVRGDMRAAKYETALEDSFIADEADGYEAQSADDLALERASGAHALGLSKEDIEEALSGAQKGAVSVRLARDLRAALASAQNCDWCSLAYEYCELGGVSALARLALGRGRALESCMAAAQVRRAVNQAAMLDDVIEKAQRALDGDVFLPPTGLRGADAHVWERLMGDAGILRGAVRVIAERERGEYAHVRNLCDRLLVHGMAASLNVNAFSAMLCEVYMDVCRARGERAAPPSAEKVMCCLEQTLPVLALMGRWRDIVY